MRRSLILLVSCCLALLSACSGRRSEQYRQEGDTYLSLGKGGEAADAYARALKLDPKNARAKVGQARGLVLQDKKEEALTVFKEAIALDPALEEAYRGAVDLLLQTGKVEDAETLAAQFEKVDGVHGGLLYATIYRQTQRDDKAVECLEKLRDKFGASAPIRTNLGEAYIAVKRFDNAEQELKTVVDGLEPGSLEARMALLDAWIGQGKLDQALPDLQTKVDANPSNQGLKLVLARALMETGKLKEAEAIATAALTDKKPNSAWANYILGSCLLKRGKPVDGLVYLQQAARDLPLQPTVAAAIRLGRTGESMLRQQGAAPAGAPTSEPSVPAPVADESWQTLWNEARLGRIIELREHLATQDDANLREVLTLSALFSLKVGLVDSLATALPGGSPLIAYVKAFQEKKPQEMLHVAEAWQEPEVRDRQILRENAYAFAYALMGSRAQALRSFSETLKKFPENGVALYNLATMYGAARMPEFEARVLYKLVGQFPANSEARDILFNVYRSSGDAGRALEVAQSSYALFPNEERAILNLAQAYADAAQFGTAVTVVQKGLEVLPGNALLQITLAKSQLMAGDLDGAQKTLAGVSAKSDLKPLADEVQAFLMAARDEWPQVLQTCEQGDPTRAGRGLRYLYAAALLHANRASDVPKAFQTKDGILLQEDFGLGRAVLVAAGATSDEGPGLGLGRVLQAAPADLPVFAYGFACLEERLNQAAYQAFNQVLVSLPNQADLVTLIFTALSRAKTIPNRVDLAKKLCDEYAALPSAWVGLGDVYASAGRSDLTEEVLEKAIQVGPEDPLAWSRYAELVQGGHDDSLALTVYRKLAALKPDDPIVGNNLAYDILQAQGDPKEAVALASAALEKLRALPRMAYVLPRVMHTLGLAQLRAGNLEEAGKNLAMALDLQPGDPTILLDFGQMLIASGDAEKGKTHINLALQYASQLGLAFPRRAEAEKTLGSPSS